MRRSNGPGVARFVAGNTATAIASHIEEKRISGSVCRSAIIHCGKGAIGIQEHLKTRHKTIESVGKSQQASRYNQREGEYRYSHLLFRCDPMGSSPTAGDFHGGLLGLALAT